MDLLQLEHFLAVVEEGSFTRAAERVCRTQPAVSLSIKKLEAEIGARLFARDAAEVSLTSAGKMLVVSARRMVQLRDDTTRQLRKIQTLTSGTLSIVAHESAAIYLLPGPLREYFRRYPEIKVSIHRSRPEDIPRQVMDREFDIGFVKDVPPFHEMKAAQVHSDELVLIASPSHPIVARAKVTITELIGERFILHHQCSSTEQQILRMFEAHNVRCNIAAEMWSFENVKEFVRQGVGLAIVPSICVAEDFDAGSLVRIPFNELNLPRKTLMIFREPQYLSESSQRFLEVMNEATALRLSQASHPVLRATSTRAVSSETSPRKRVAHMHGSTRR